MRHQLLFYMGERHETLILTTEHRLLSRRQFRREFLDLREKRWQEAEKNRTVTSFVICILSQILLRLRQRKGHEPGEFL